MFFYLVNNSSFLVNNLSYLVNNLNSLLLIIIVPEKPHWGDSIKYVCIVCIKAETHDATNRGDTSRREVASSALLLRQGCLRCFVTAICRTNSNQFKLERQIAATKFCRSDNEFHMSHEAICCSNLSRRCVAAICRIVCLGLKSFD